MCRTEDGNIILGGVTTDNGYPGIRKINQDAEVLWTQDFFLSGSGIGRINSIIQTSDGGFATTGYTSGNGFDLFVLKTDDNGDSLWTQIFDGSGQFDQGWSIIENYESSIFVSGYFEGNNRTYYGVLIKLDIDGGLIFLLNEENSEDYYLSKSMVESINDNKIVCYGRDADGLALNAYNYEGENLWTAPLPVRVPALGDRGLQLVDDGFILGGLSWDWDIALVKTDNNGQITAIDDEIISLFDHLLFNYPNPFNPSTSIEFSIQNDSNVELSVFNIKGQKVRILADNDFDQGSHSIIWDGNDELGNSLSSGIYLYKLIVNGKTEAVKKCLLLK